MSRIARIAPYLEAMSEDLFQGFLLSAARAAEPTTVYSRMTTAVRAEIDEAIERLDDGKKNDLKDVVVVMREKVRSARA